MPTLHRRFTAAALALLIGVQAAPALMTVAGFFAQREALTERYCINALEPTLDCRAACYLDAELADIVEAAEDGGADGPSTRGELPNFGPSYVVPEAVAFAMASVTESDGVRRVLPHVATGWWATRVLGVATPPPLG